MDYEPKEQPRESKIAEIMQSNDQIFKEYLASPDFRPQELPIPVQARAVFIPRKVLESSNNPEKVEIQTVTESLKNSLWLRIVERDREMPKVASGSNPYNFLSGTAKINFEEPGSHPFVYLAFLIQNAKERGLPEVIEVDQYEDNPDLRGQGMSKDFYANLENILRLLKYKFIFGHHNKDNIDYFVNTLGRKKLAEHPDYWKFNPWGMEKPTNQFLTFKEL